MDANKSRVVVLNWQNKFIDIIDVIAPATQNVQKAYSNKINKDTENCVQYGKSNNNSHHDVICGTSVKKCKKKT